MSITKENDLSITKMRLAIRWPFSKTTANIAFFVIIFFILLGLFAPFLTVNDSIEVNLANKLLPVSKTYPFGTDHLGRCIFSRIIDGTRTSLFTSISALSLIVLISLPLGYIAGYFGGVVDQIIMRIVDTLLAFPSLILSMVLAGLFGPNLRNVVISIVLVWWASYARIIRSLVMAEKNKEYIMANRACGASSWTIFYRHILPNIASSVLILCTIDIGRIILTISGMSFLGLGAQPPTPEWGAMLSDGRNYMQIAPHQIAFPAGAIIIVALAFNILGDELRDIGDPKTK
jgi:peptide/nickel transport system permease protein